MWQEQAVNEWSRRRRWRWRWRRRRGWRDGDDEWRSPQLAGLFAGGMPKLRPTGKGISTSPSRSGPLLPPGRKPAPGIPSGDSADSDNTSTNNNNNSIPPSPKTARANSMRVNRSDLQNHRFSAEENLLPSRTLPPSHHHKSSPGHPAKPNTVGRYMGVNIVRSMTRPPTDRPPPPPISRPSVPPPSQPPPPPPSRAVTASKPELPSSAPPQPPSRHSSHLSRSSGSEFESKFYFHTLHEFPLPITFSNCLKTYPSKNGKSTRRPGMIAPPPPPPSSHTRPVPPACPLPAPPHPAPANTFGTIPAPTPPPCTSIPPPPLLPFPSSASPPPPPPPVNSSQPPSFAANYNLRRGFQPGQKFAVQNATRHASDV
ncbi:uncharacterized protein LOC135090060 isoform X5 [Scylla paramamosain]|uniref:uncharacterized protein LOC135090060 isoform X5 n=1 Tax=Scylla paramamosain TaxID=85552 RepID=UPI003083B490